MDKNMAFALVVLTLILGMLTSLVWVDKLDVASLLLVVGGVVTGIVQRYFPTTAARTNGGTIPPVGPALGVIAALGLSTACTPAERQQAMNTTQDVSTHISYLAPLCEDIATMHGRQDIVEACKTTGGIAELISRLLSEAEQAKALQPSMASIDTDAGEACPVQCMLECRK